MRFFNHQCIRLYISKWMTIYCIYIYICIVWTNIHIHIYIQYTYIYITYPARIPHDYGTGTIRTFWNHRWGVRVQTATKPLKRGLVRQRNHWKTLGISWKWSLISCWFMISWLEKIGESLGWWDSTCVCIYIYIYIYDYMVLITRVVVLI